MSVCCVFIVLYVCIRLSILAIIIIIIPFRCFLKLSRPLLNTSRRLLACYRGSVAVLSYISIVESLLLVITTSLLLLLNLYISILFFLFVVYLRKLLIHFFLSLFFLSTFIIIIVFSSNVSKASGCGSERYI